MFHKTVWLRGWWTLVAATAAICLYCAILSVETTLFGPFVIPFIAVSVVLFLLLEDICLRRLPKYLGFFVPVCVIGGALFCQMWSLRSQAARIAHSDGADQMIALFLECYGIGLCVAFVCMTLGRKGRRGIPISGQGEPNGPRLNPRKQCDMNK